MSTTAHQSAITARDRNSPGNTRLWGAILGLALVTRLLVLWSVIAQHSAVWLYSRGMEMGFLADSFLHGRGLASPFGGNTGPTAFIAPGYPLLVAGVFRVFGTYTAASAVFIMLMQIAVSVVTGWLMMRLAEALFGARAAVITGVFWAVWPPLLWVPTIFWETSLSLCFLVCVLLFALHLRRGAGTSLWAGSGVFCGIAALINMALLLTSVAVFLWLAFYTWRERRAQLLLAAGLFLTMYSPWPIRNAHVFHAFVPLRTTIGLELWMGNHEGASGYLEESMFPMYNRHEMDTYLRDGELAYNQKKTAQAHDYMRQHPATFVKLSALRFVRFWTGTGTRNGPSIYGFGATLTTLGGFSGLYLLYRKRRYELAVLFSAPLLLFPLPYYITHAEFRYRLVLEPLLTVLSGYALAAMLRAKQIQARATAGPAIKAQQEHVLIG